MIAKHRKRDEETVTGTVKVDEKLREGLNISAIL